MVLREGVCFNHNPVKKRDETDEAGSVVDSLISPGSQIREQSRCQQTLGEVVQGPGACPDIKTSDWKEGKGVSASRNTASRQCLGVADVCRIWRLRHAQRACVSVRMSSYRCKLSWQVFIIFDKRYI